MDTYVCVFASQPHFSSMRFYANTLFQRQLMWTFASRHFKLTTVNERNACACTRTILKSWYIFAYESESALGGICRLKKFPYYQATH